MCTDRIDHAARKHRQEQFREKQRISDVFFWFITVAVFLCWAAFLTGCAGSAADLQPDGLHTHTRTCYKNKGCAVSDCVVHYEAAEKAAAQKGI